MSAHFKNGASPEHGTRFQWRILLITESLIDQKLATGLLIRHGHEVIVANNGPDAVLELESASVDLVIVDWSVAEDSRLDLMRVVKRQRHSGKSVPVLALAYDVEEVGEECKQLGFDGLIEKPIRVEDVASCVALAKRNAKPAAASGHSAAAGQPEPIDWNVALDAVGGRRDLLTELIDIFFTEYPPTLDEIRQAIERQDAKGLQLSAHKLKGCLRYFGQTLACERAKELEDMGRSGQLEGALPRLEDLDLAVTRLLPSLRLAP